MPTTHPAPDATSGRFVFLLRNVSASHVAWDVKISHHDAGSTLWPITDFFTRTRTPDRPTLWWQITHVQNRGPYVLPFDYLEFFMTEGDWGTKEFELQYETDWGRISERVRFQDLSVTFRVSKPPWR